MLSSSNARLAAARRLTRRQGRREAGRFLAEGAQAVREALAAGRRPRVVRDRRGDRSPSRAHRRRRTRSRRRTPPRCPRPSRRRGWSRSAGWTSRAAPRCSPRAPRLLALLVEPNEPGNLGTIIRTADAAGADAVFVDGGADPVQRQGGAGQRRQPVPPPGRSVRGRGLPRRRSPCGPPDARHDRSRRSEPRRPDRGRHPRAPGPVAVRQRGARTCRTRFSKRPIAASASRSTAAAESLNLAAAAAVALYASARAHRRHIRASRPS